MIRRALSLISLRLLFEQFTLALAVFLLVLVWLRVPDSSWAYVLATVMMTALIVAVAGAGETHIACKLSGVTPTRTTFVRGSLLLLAAMVLWYGWDAGIAHMAEKAGLWAGYLNSRFPHGMRHVFSYPHLLTWLGWMWTVLEWVGTGLLLVVAFHLAAGTHLGLRKNLRALGWWETFIATAILVCWLTGKITGWTPGHGLSVETTSFVVRMAATVVLDTAAVVFLLAMCSTFEREA